MSSYDAERFGINRTVTIAMKDEDIRRAKEIMNYPWFKNKKDWQKEIQHMLSTGVKLELEALSSKDFSFITEDVSAGKDEEETVAGLAGQGGSIHCGAGYSPQ